MISMAISTILASFMVIGRKNILADHQCTPYSYESAGDEYVKCSLCGMDHLGEWFAESPPYCDFSEVNEEEGDRRTWIKDRMPGDENVNMDVFKFSKCDLPR
jgi:hypothetical protein